MITRSLLPNLAEPTTAARCYLLLVLPMLLALNFVFIPFHAPDDYDHLKRAYTLTHMTLWPANHAGRSSGGYIDAALSQMIDAQIPAIHDWPREGTPRQPLGASPSIREGLHWSGVQIFSEFSGSVSYLPLVYAPQSVALLLGEKLDMTVESSILTARLLNGITAVLIIAVTLAYMPYGNHLTLALLLLPKTLVHFASNSADPILHALTLAIIVFTARCLVEKWVPRTWHFLVVSFCLLVLLGARPPMMWIALLPLMVAWRHKDKVAVVSLLLATGCAIGWFAVVMPQITELRCGETGTLGSKTLTFLGSWPWLIGRSLWEHKAYYYVSFIGELGWGNGPEGATAMLPQWIYAAATTTMLLALGVDLGRGFRLSSWERIAFLACGAGIVGTTFFAMYGICTNSQASSIGGVQGRYFMAPVLLAVPALSGLARPMKAISSVYAPLFLAYSLASFGVLMSEGLRIYWIR